jgi:tRNA nucleotidyltransferase (CCA-adding enzyme)
MSIFLSPFIHMFAERIANEPQNGVQPPRVFYVGGTVRDRVRGDDALHDVDVEVYGVEPKRIRELLEELSGRAVDVFGAAFGVYKLSFDDGVLDVALPRAESKKGRGHRGFTITGDPHLSFFDALRRRDFTMNAMLADVLTAEIIDPFHGQDDIVQGVLRVVDANTFSDDSLRLFRAMQFVARFGYRAEEKSLQLFCKMARSKELATISPERITGEWKKMLCAPYPEKGLRFLEETGLLAQYPELDVLRSVEQDANWHPEGSVWEHVVRCFEVASRGQEGDFDVLAWRLALLLHDGGKAVVTKKVGKKLVDEGHGQAGVSVAKTFFDRFTFGERVERDVLACVAYHEELPHIYQQARQDEWSDAKIVNALRMLWRDVGVERVPLFLAVCEANARGRALPLDDRAYPVATWALLFTQRHDLFVAAASPLLTGEDLQNIAARLHVALPKGKAFGMMLSCIESARDRGEIATRNEAIAYAEEALAFEKAS